MRVLVWTVLIWLSSVLPAASQTLNDLLKFEPQKFALERRESDILERGAALAPGQWIEACDIHIDDKPAKENGAAVRFLPSGMTLDQWEEELISEALRRADGNKSQAARLLGLSRNAFRYRLSKIGVADDPDDKD